MTNLSTIDLAVVTGGAAKPATPPRIVRSSANVNTRELGPLGFPSPEAGAFSPIR